MRFSFTIILILLFAQLSFSQDWENFTTDNSPLSSNQFRSICIDVGQPIRKLIHKNLKMGSHAIIWNGKTEQGSDVSSGIYLVRISDEKLSVFQKLVVVK
jgi:flagellar hook assembly protein FlgD